MAGPFNLKGDAERLENLIHPTNPMVQFEKDRKLEKANTPTVDSFLIGLVSNCPRLFL